MPLYDFQCLTCHIVERDVWENVKDIHNHNCPHCGEQSEVMIHAVACAFGTTFHDPGVIRQFEMVYTDSEGKEHVRDMREIAARQPKGKLTTPWDGKKASSEEVKAMARDAGT
jgi:putative FmdB family regulatory protein